MQSLFYIIVLSISCNLLNTVLKVRNRMVVRVSVVNPRDGVANWELWLAPAVQHHKRILYYMSLVWGGKIQIQESKCGFYQILAAFTPSQSQKTISCSIVSQGPSVSKNQCVFPAGQNVE